MRRTLALLAIPCGLALVWLALTLIPGMVGGPAHAEVYSAPPVPHPLEGRAQCVACHGTGSASVLPADHQGRDGATCSACHQPAGASTKASAAPSGAGATQTQPVNGTGTGQGAGPAPDATCLACHQGPVNVALPGGGTFSAKIEPAELAASVHGKSVSCAACHKDKASGYPHPKVAAADKRAYVVAASGLCLDCHKAVDPVFQQSVHGQALASGNGQAATCVDCHGAHSVSPAARLERRPELCASCHSVVTETYRDSVHGQLLASGRADAASCLSCHTKQSSAHTLAVVADPEGPTAARNVPDTCGKCHQQALKTYNQTFHGRAMRLGVSGNAPNCVDCHGAYGVQRVHASTAPLDETKLATTCGKCHEGANVSFASGWMGHEEASPAWFPAVFFTERFLFFLTTTVVAFGILHVEFDLLRWLVVRRRNGNDEKEEKR